MNRIKTFLMETPAGVGLLVVVALATLYVNVIRPLSGGGTDDDASLATFEDIPDLMPEEPGHDAPPSRTVEFAAHDKHLNLSALTIRKTASIDPFRARERNAGQRAAASLQQLHLTAIISGGQGHYAVVNGRIVEPGGTISGYRITGITPRAVALAGVSGNAVLHLVGN